MRMRFFNTIACNAKIRMCAVGYCERADLVHRAMSDRTSVSDEAPAAHGQIHRQLGLCGQPPRADLRFSHVERKSVSATLQCLLSTLKALVEAWGVLYKMFGACWSLAQQD